MDGQQAHDKKKAHYHTFLCKCTSMWHLDTASHHWEWFILKIPEIASAVGNPDKIHYCLETIAENVNEFSMESSVNISEKQKYN